MLGLVGGAPGGETPRVADSPAAGAGRVVHAAYLAFYHVTVLALVSGAPGPYLSVKLVCQWTL